MKMKKLLALLLGATMLLSSATAINASAVTTDKPATAITEEARGIEVTGSCGSNATFSIVDGVMTISGTGSTSGYNFNGRNDVYSVIIEEGITGLGAGAFYGTNENIAHVFLPASLTTMYASSLSGCSALETITLAAGNTSFLLEDGILYNADKTSMLSFPSGASVTSIYIPATMTTLDTAGLTNNKNLETITVEDSHASYSSFDGVLFNKAQTEFVAVPFKKTQLTIPDGIAKEKLEAGSLQYLENLTYVSVSDTHPDFTSVDGVLFSKDMEVLCLYPAGKMDKSYTVPSSVSNFSWESWTYTYIFEPFSNCRYLETIDMSSTSVTEVRGFSDCSSLKSITLPETVDTVKSYAFEGCISLKSITLPETVTEIGGNAFRNSGLESITIPANVTTLNYGSAAFDTFVGCNNLTEINVDPANANYSSVDGVLFDKTGATLLCFPGGITGHYDIPNTVTTLCSCSFDSTHLTSIGFEENSNLTTFGTNYGDTQFSVLCKTDTLKYLYLPETITSINPMMIYDCPALEAIFFAGNSLPTGYETAMVLPKNEKGLIMAQTYVLNGGTVDLSEENPVPTLDDKTFVCYSESNDSLIVPSYTKYDRSTFGLTVDPETGYYQSSVYDLKYRVNAGSYYAPYPVTYSAYYYIDENGDEVQLDSTYVLYATYEDVTEESVSADDRVIDATQTSTLVGLETLGLQIRNVEKQGYEEQPRGYISTSDSGEATRFVGALTDETITSLVSGGCEILEYGFVVAKKNSVSANSLTVDDANATVVNCASSYAFSDGTVVTNPGADIDKDRSNTDTYRIFSLVIEYEGASEELKAEEIVGRAYLKYVDGNGKTSVIYGRYGGTLVKGGCSASYNQVAEAAWNEILRH